MTAADQTPFRFGVNENGEYGYILTDEDGADAVILFSKDLVLTQVTSSSNQAYSLSYKLTKDATYLIVGMCGLWLIQGKKDASVTFNVKHGSEYYKQICMRIYEIN